MLLIDSHIVPFEETPIRFVDYAIGIFALTPTKNAVKKAIKRKELYLNGLLAEGGRFVKENDKIELFDLENRSPKHFELDIDILYEDDYLALVNKPSGLLVNGNQFQTLENALVDVLTKSNQADAFGWSKPVHRLDGPTSGLVVFAKTLKAHHLLSKLFEEKKIEKTYTAIVVGTPSERKGVLLSSIQDKHAETHYEVIESFASLRNNSLTHLELRPKTGRTHQLRIHCKTLGHPIVGDKMYGEPGQVLLHKGLFLHAQKLNFTHPFLHQEIKIDTGVPYKFLSFIEREKRRWKKFKG
mgnify:CR=1 FL=1